MVSFNNAGRLGNWMYEAATAIAYALKHNLEFTVPSSTHDTFWQPVYASWLVNPNWNASLSTIRLWENGHHYQPLEFQEAWRDCNIIIEGYRQSEKYFKEYRNEIIYLLNIPYTKREGVVAVHVRRGDYLILRDKHPEVTREWYEQAMAMFPNYKFKVYSDDLAWCRQQWQGRDDVEFSAGASEWEDMIDGACCEHSIISASTFGWWIGWLNQNPDKKVVLPKLWFVPNYSLDTKDIVPSEWIKL